MRITENFTLEELVYSVEAIKHNISNSPDADVVAKLINLVKGVLQPSRDKLGKAISVTSGYRCPELNALVGGATTSQHTKGEAADLRCSNNKKLFDIIKDMDFDQLIWEYGTDKNPAWVHVSYCENNRREVLIAKKIDGKTKYIPYNNG